MGIGMRGGDRMLLRVDQKFLNINNISYKKGEGGTDFLKAIFFTRPIFMFETFAQTKWDKNQQKNVKNVPKM